VIENVAGNGGAPVGVSPWLCVVVTAGCMVGDAVVELRNQQPQWRQQNDGELDGFGENRPTVVQETAELTRLSLRLGQESRT